MTTSPEHTKIKRNFCSRLALALAGLGITAALAVQPSFASSSDCVESCDKHESGCEESCEKHRSGTVESKFYGTVQKIPSNGIGTWKVNNREIIVTTATRIEEEYGKAESGSYVEVIGRNSDKGFTAHEIEVKRAKK